MFKKNQKKIILFLIGILILLLQWIKNYPQFIEKYYGAYFYPFYSKCLRWISNVVSFSIGDWLYTFLVIWISYQSYLTFKHFKSRKKYIIYDVLITLSGIYLLFYGSWGLNYYRPTLKEKWHLQTEYSDVELIQLTHQLIKISNELQLQLCLDKNKIVQNPYTHHQIFAKASGGYKYLCMKYPELNYKHPSIKTSVWSLPLTYMGFSGYLNPFTLEAQVNSYIPLYQFPTTTCHEMAHQLGIAPESEANFIGHLASVHHNDLYFKYSGYTYALRYCLNEIWMNDEKKYYEIEKTIHPGILKNFAQTEALWLAYESPIEWISKKIYGNYLEINAQKGGMKTYHAFVGLMIAYYRNHPLEVK
jgi:hypothetical protein